MKKLLEAIGNFFTSIFKGAKKTWDNLPEPTKDAILTGSGITDILNKMLDSAPATILQVIHERYPDLADNELVKSLDDALLLIGIDVDAEIEEKIDLLKLALKKAKEKNAKVWANLSDAFAKAIAIVRAPEGTKFAAVASMMVWAYHTFIKKAE